MRDRRRPKLFYGWVMAWAVALISYVTDGSFFYGFGTFFNPIRNEFGWGAAVTAAAFTVHRLQGGIAAPLVGFFIDRLGPRRFMVFGLVAVGTGFVLLSQINSMLTFYLALFVVSFGFSAGIYGGGMAAVANWFIKKRARAISIVTIGAGLSGTVAPVLRFLIDHYGWRTTAIIVGVAVWVICVPLASLIRHRPEQYGYLPDGDDPQATAARGKVEPGRGSERGLWKGPGGAQAVEQELTWGQVVRSRNFWLLALANGLSNLTMSTTFVLAIPHLENVGIRAQTAAFAITLITLTSILGRLFVGWLGDRLDKRYLLAGAVTLQGLGVLIFAQVSALWMIIPFALLFSPGYGAGIPLRPALVAECFGRRVFASASGSLQGVITFMTMGAPFLGGLIFDLTGSYRLAFLLFGLLTLLAGPVLLSIRRPQTAAPSAIAATRAPVSRSASHGPGDTG